MGELRLMLASSEAEQRFAQELTRNNMELLTIRHWGEWRADVLAAHFLSWNNFLVCEDARPIAYVGAQRCGDVLVLHNLQIQALHRGRGIGRWALDALIAENRYQSCRFMDADVFKDNPAVSFFIRLGFELVGEEEHCVALRRALDATTSS